jgi:hypothetical protein
LLTDASLRGWGAVLFRGASIETIGGPDDLSVKYGSFLEEEHISTLEARALLYGIQLIPRTASRQDVNIFVDNETLRFAFIKGYARTYNLNKVVCSIHGALKERNITAVIHRVASRDNIADVLTRL